MLLLAFGCIDNGVEAKKLNDLAVVVGDFDEVQTALTRLRVPTIEFDGLIVQATYEPDDDRTVRGEGGVSVETLFTEPTAQGGITIDLYQGVFVNSGTRGLNAWQYNDLFTADDAILQDPVAVENVCNFANKGGLLVVSDWAYDLVEACWPDAIEFIGDDSQTDGAQTGQAATVTATVEDATLAEALAVSEVSLAYNYTNWAVIDDVGSDTEVLLSGDVSYQASSGELYTDLPDAPLLVRFPAGQGRVVFSSFHWGVQSAGLTDALLLGSVEGLSDAQVAQTETP